jgi:hypothetical protein
VEETCFSASTLVNILGRDSAIPMKDLKVGDQVLTSQGDGQMDKYQSVYAFGHIDPNVLATFVRIYTKDTADTPLELTAEHMVYVYGKTRPVRSDSIQVGDILRGHNGSASTVTKISTIQGIWIVQSLDSFWDHCCWWHCCFCLQ